MRLIPLPAFQDNYIWLLADATGNALVVDPGDATPVLTALAREQLRLCAILLTHHHDDHIGGVHELLAYAHVPVFAPKDSRITQASSRVGDGDFVELKHPKVRFAVLAIPGHTHTHVAYMGEGLLFCGDTLFSAGCGRLFEGSPQQMLTSLDRLSALADDTLICCGHEYTLANCAFAQTLEPENAALAERTETARQLRNKGKPTLPARLADERAYNPFLRIDTPEIMAHFAQIPGNDRITRFAALRQRKDEFRIPPR